MSEPAPRPEAFRTGIGASGAAETAPAPTGPECFGSKAGWVGAALVFAVGWLLAIRPMAGDWWVNPQYQFGLLVPLLCVVLWRGRISDRPERAEPGTFGKWMACGLIAGCALLVAAAQPFYEANPGWRLVGGVAALAMVAFTLAFVYLAGGWPWLRHFAFPVAFILIAVPLSTRHEEPLMTWLMQKNAGATVDVLGWLGYDAIRSGNLIRLPDGVLGIEEACSGVRSLRSGLMAALFVGEFFRVGLGARFGLLGLAVGTALAGNFLRTFFLAVMASARGIDRVHVWHDPAGLSILMATILVVWFAASKLAERLPPQPVGASAKGAAPYPWHRGLIAAVGCFWLCAAAGTEWWFRLHEQGRKVAPAWSVQIPATIRDGRHLPIAESTALMLRYDEGASISWLGDAGLRWQCLYLRWNPSSLLPSQMTLGHTPEICLSASGMTLEGQLGVRVYEKSEIRVAFNRYRFSDRNMPVYVFHALVEDAERSNLQRVIATDGSYRRRWEAVVRGKRNRGQRLVEIGVWGAADLAEAEKGLREFLDHALVIEGTPPVGESLPLGK